MRGWFSGRATRLIAASVGLLALTVGTLLMRSSGSPSEATPPTSTTATGDGAASDVPAVVTISPAALDMPVDPSGARRVQSETGARRSALDYVTTVRQRVVYLTPSAATQLVTDWAAEGVDPAVIQADVDGATATREALEANGGPVWWAAAPLGIQVLAYTPERAEVSVWTVAVGAGSADADHDMAVVPVAHYQTITVDLLWDGSRWSVWSTTTVDGPAPMLAPSQTPSAPAEFFTAVGGFELIKEHN